MPKLKVFTPLLKCEMIYQFRFPSIAHLILDVSKYIHWFNNERNQSCQSKIKSCLISSDLDKNIPNY